MVLQRNMRRNKPRIRVCDDTDSSSVCLASSINALQLKGLRDKGVRIYTIANGKLSIVANVPAETAYLYLPPTARCKLLPDDHDTLRNDGVKTLYIYRQVPRKLECEHLETVKITPDTEDRKWWVWALVILAVIIVAAVICYFYYRSPPVTDKVIIEEKLHPITLLL